MSSEEPHRRMRVRRRRPYVLALVFFLALPATADANDLPNGSFMEH